MPDEKTIEPHAEAVEQATHEPETVGNPEHANPQPMMANAPTHKAEHELPPSDEAEPDPSADAHPTEEPVHPEPETPDDHHPEEHSEEHIEDSSETDDEEKDEDQPEEPPTSVPGTPANTGTMLPGKPVDPATPPDPDTIVGSKTASSHPTEGVPILDSNHTLSHIPPRDTKPTVHS